MQLQRAPKSSSTTGHQPSASQFMDKFWAKCIHGTNNYRRVLNSKPISNTTFSTSSWKSWLPGQCSHSEMVTIEQIQSFIPKKQIQKYYKAYNLSWAEKDGQAYIYIYIYIYKRN